MTNLTEQWKKGELKSGWYYITTSFADEALREYFDGDEFRTVFTCNVKQVLAPVPSYEEYSRLEWYAGCGPDRIVELNHENRKLKELLKRCQNSLEGTMCCIAERLVDEIDEVLNVAKD